MSHDTLPDIDILSRNKDLAEALGLIASYYIIDRDTYRARTYTNASTNIAAYPSPITSGNQARKNIKGIGASVQTDIDEFLLTGTIKRLQELENKFATAQTTINYFQSFYGIGPVTAAKFYNLGYRTLEDLWTKANLTEAQKIGIMWREHIALRIPRDEMDEINNVLSDILNPYGIKWTIAGSYRRGETSSGDIDILVEEREDLNMDGLVYLLQKYLPANLAQGLIFYMGIFRVDENHNGHRIDIRLINKQSYPYALLYFTGSQRFNILMRQRAIELGMTLNEYGLYLTNGTLVPTYSEEDIFSALKVKYISPIERIKTLERITYL